MTENLLQSHPNIDGVLAANDSMALGALEAFDGANRKVLAVGINGTKEAMDAIKAGRLLASGDNNGYVQGCIGTMAAIRRLRKLPVPKEVVFPAVVIDSTNYKTYDILDCAAELPEVGECGEAMKMTRVLSRELGICAWLRAPCRSGAGASLGDRRVRPREAGEGDGHGDESGVEQSTHLVLRRREERRRHRDELGILRRRARRAAAARHQPRRR